MASIRLGGIRFVAYSNDHPPRHVHGIVDETEIIIDLRKDGSVRLAERANCVRPANAKKATIRHILQTAAENFDELAALCERVHGNRA